MQDFLSLGDEVAVSLGRGCPLEDTIKARGHVRVEVFDSDGKLKDVREVDNLVVTVGKNHIADRLSASPAEAAMSHMAVGTSSTAPAAGNTTLGAEIDRNALTSAIDSGNVITYIGDWAAGDATNSAIAEAGIFNAASSGTMLARATFTAIDKGASDTLKITWTVTIG